MTGGGKETEPIPEIPAWVFVEQRTQELRYECRHGTELGEEHREAGKKP